MITGTCYINHRATLNWNRSLLLLAVSLILLSTGCQRLKWSGFQNTDIPEEFNKSNFDTSSLLDSVNSRLTRIDTFSGSAKVLVSGPERSERVSIEFSNAGDSTYIKIKGALGVEGARFWMAGDSLYLHDRLEEERYRYGLHDYGLPFPFVYLRFLRFSDLMNPTLSNRSVGTLWESSDIYLLTYKSGKKVYIRKSDFTVRKKYYPELELWPSLDVEYDGYDQMNRIFIPRKIQLSNKEDRFRLFLLIQKLETNKAIHSLIPFESDS